MATVSALSRYIGDDWTISVAVQDSTGVPIDLTGLAASGLLFVDSSAVPLPLTGANGSVTVTDKVNGALTIFVSRTATAATKPQGTSKTYPNRIQVITTDAEQRQTTLGIILIAPVAP